VGIVYLNGEFLPQAEARVPVLDRGFVFGDGVYEVIPAYSGKLFRLPHHLARLHNSLDAVRIANPLTDEQWQDLLQQLLARNQLTADTSIYLQVTRGVAARDHAFPEDATPTVFAMASPIKLPPAQQYEQGVSVITLEDIRWQRCDIKAITLLANVLLKQQALDAGATEAILVRDGEVTEGTASDVFAVQNGLLLTPPSGPRLLPGITRDLVLELAQANGIPCAEARLVPADLAQADEIWLTSSTREIVPVTQLDSRPVGMDKPGPLYQQIRRIYADFKKRL
jgi:D-alanine transaminase